MISLFDLAVVFADDYTVRIVNKSTFEASNRSLRNISSQFIRPVYKKRQHSESDSQSGSGDDNSASDATLSETESTSEQEADNDDDDDLASRNLKQFNRTSTGRKGNNKDKVNTETDGDTTIIAASESFSESMDRMSNKYDQLLGFIVAGLKSFARVGVYTEHLDTLAERLELEAMVGGMRSQDFELERD